MPLGMEVCLSSGDFVLDDPVPPPQKEAEHPSPICGPFLLWPNGWMYPDATWYGGRPQPRRLCFRWGPSPSPKRGRSPSPILGSCLLWQLAKRLDGSRCHLVQRYSLDPGHIMLDGDQAPPPNGAQPQIFDSCLLWQLPKRLDG